MTQIGRKVIRRAFRVSAGLLRDTMAHHKSAKKRIVRNAHRFEINHARISRIRTFVKKVEKAIASGDHAAAKSAFVEAQPEMQRGVSKGVLHRNTVSRKLSRMNARIKALSA